MTKERNRLSDFLAGSSGVAAVEFAFIIPLFVFLFLGAVSLFSAARAANQASTASVVVSDLATRIVEMDDARLEEFAQTADYIMHSWSADADTSITITSVVISPEDEDGPDNEESDSGYQVDWSVTNKSQSGSTVPDLDSFTLPSIEDNESFVIVTVEGVYKPTLAGFGLPTEYTFTRNSIRRPRFVLQIPYVD